MVSRVPGGLFRKMIQKAGVALGQLSQDENQR